MKWAVILSSQHSAGNRADARFKIPLTAPKTEQLLESPYKFFSLRSHRSKNFFGVLFAKNTGVFRGGVLYLPIGLEQV